MPESAKSQGPIAVDATDKAVQVLFPSGHKVWMPNVVAAYVAELEKDRAALAVLRNRIATWQRTHEECALILEDMPHAAATEVALSNQMALLLKPAAT